MQFARKGKGAVVKEKSGRQKGQVHPWPSGARHLEELAAAGLTHVHLLPTYDFGSVPERPGNQLQPEVRLAPAKERKAGRSANVAGAKP